MNFKKFIKKLDRKILVISIFLHISTNILEIESYNYKGDFMFKMEEIEFMRIYVSLLYKNGYCYFDTSKEYLDDYLHELRKIIESKKEFEKYKYLENIFIFDDIMNSYTNFKNLILYVTHHPKYSFEDEKANIIMVKYDDEILKNNLEKINYMNLNTIDMIVEYMINHINQNIKIKVITK